MENRGETTRGETTRGGKRLGSETFCDRHLPVSDNGNDLLNSLEKFDNLFRDSLTKSKILIKATKPP